MGMTPQQRISTHTATTLGQAPCINDLTPEWCPVLPYFSTPDTPRNSIKIFILNKKPVLTLTPPMFPIPQKIMFKYLRMILI